MRTRNAMARHLRALNPDMDDTNMALWLDAAWREERPPLTTGQLVLWLDALTRQYGPDLPLYVQASGPDAPAEVCLDARVQRGPSGERVVVLSAQALPRREGDHAAID